MSELTDSTPPLKEIVDTISANSESVEMANESKEISLENIPEITLNPSKTLDEGIFAMLYSATKKIATVGIIYLIGYMGWSVAWLIAPVLLSVTRDQWKKTNEAKRSVAKASAVANEKDVILARIDELPAWVYFPDVERCEWLNRILKQVWPNANHYARGILKDIIEPNVNKAIEAYKLRGFKFERMILGTIPPRLGGVKVYDKNVARNEIILDVDLFYASDCDISFTLAGVRGGIKDFQVHGTLRVVMKPLIQSMPFIGGLQIFFLNNPNIDFNLVGIADLLDMPGLSDMMRRIIVEQVASLMVLPNKLRIQLSDAVPALALKMPEPEGVLRIHVIEAKDLMKKDIGVLTKGKSDPYAIITIGAQQFRTQTIDSNVNPKWDYWCEGIVHAEMGQFLQIELRDEDKSSDDELLGRATVEISSVAKKGLVDTWLTLEEAKHGLLHVRLSWLQLSNDRNDLKYALHETQMLRVTSMNTALVTIFIDSAKNLPHARAQSNPDPFLLISVGKKTDQTATQMRTDSPVWEQGFTFLVNNPENDTIQMKIVDQKTEKELGRLTYVMSNLLEKKNLEIISQPFQLQKSGPESKLYMSLQLRIFKKSEQFENDNISISSHDKAVITGGGPVVSGLSEGGLSRTSSYKEPPLLQSQSETTSQLSKQDSKLSSSSGVVEDMSGPEDIIFASTNTIQLASTPPRSPDLSEGSEIYHRQSKSTSSLANQSGTPDNACKIQVTLRYSVQRQRLMVIIHKIVNIPMKDPSNIPDPYVKLYLLPGRSKESKQKTGVCKDNCNPVFDAQFEYLISAAELQNSELEVTAATQKGFLSSGSPVIGVVRISLSDPEISQQGITLWHELLRDIKDD